jgi:beta-mannosidase
MRRKLLSQWCLLFSGKTYRVHVPGDFLHDLAENHVIPDPDYADNIRQAQPYLHQEALYQTTIVLWQLSPHMVLHFEGIDTFSEITFNGVLLGKTRNMFIPYDFDVTSLAHLGTNTLEVKLLPVYRFLDEQDHGWSLFNKERMQLRKAACHFGWDWSPNLPGYGIYLPAYLDSYQTRIENLEITPSLDGHVMVKVEVNGDCQGDIVIDQQNYGSFALQKGKNEIPLAIANPKLWYPNGYGRSVLYRGTISLIDKGEVSEVKAFHFAFRKIEVFQEPLADGRTSFGFKVNGIRIFARGSNLVPCSNQTGAIPDETYRRLLEDAKEAHFNLIRVWGGGFYEKEIFYDLCDHLGLLVWQDFMFACQKTPIYPGFWADVQAEVVYQTRRIHQHPCLALFSGGNELYYKKEEVDNPLNAFLKKTVAEEASDVAYIPSSPFGTNEDQWDLLSGDSHASCFEKALQANDVTNYPKYIDQNRAQFYSESGILGSCSLSSLKRFIPADKLWPFNSLYDLHFFKNPYALNPKETFALKELRLGEALFGPIDNAADFAKKSALAQAEILASEISYARTNPDCAGFMNWMFNDNWGCGTWSLIDFYGVRKPAYYAAMRAYRPLICPFVYRDGRWHLYLVNGSGKSHCVVLDYGVSNGKKTIEEKKEVILIRSGEILEISLADFALEEADYLFASLYEKARLLDQNIHFVKMDSGRQFVSQISYRLLRKKRGGVILRLKADAFARAVHLLSVLPLHYSDNDFDLREGEVRDVEITGLRAEELGQLTVKSLADIWEE